MNTSLHEVLFCCIGTLVLGITLAYEEFGLYIPNGRKVPDPCSVTFRYVGPVGHYKGSSARNPFGQDFKRYGMNWTALCPLDSDNDGYTNGQELGDFKCVWNRYNLSTHADIYRRALGHPGIPERFSRRQRRMILYPQVRMVHCGRFRW